MCEQLVDLHCGGQRWDGAVHGGGEGTGGRGAQHRVVHTESAGERGGQRAAERIAGSGRIDRIDRERRNVRRLPRRRAILRPGRHRHAGGAARDDHRADPGFEQSVDTADQVDLVLVGDDHVDETEQRVGEIGCRRGIDDGGRALRAAAEEGVGDRLDGNLELGEQDAS